MFDGVSELQSHQNSKKRKKNKDIQTKLVTTRNGYMRWKPNHKEEDGFACEMSWRLQLT